MKQAKISIIADMKGFKTQVDAAKKSVESLTKVKFSPEAGVAVRRLFTDQITGQMKAAEKQAVILQKRIEQIGKGGIVDQARLGRYVQYLDTINEKLADLKKAEEKVNGISPAQRMSGYRNGAPPPPSGGSGGGGAPGEETGMLGRLGGFAKTIGLAMGAMAIYSRRLQMAQERTAIRETGSELGTETSALGFTPTERRARMLSTSRAMGRRVGSAEMTSLTDLGESAQRAYGISGDETAGSLSVARKANAEPEKFLSNAIGAAVASKLDGSRIGEFLQASTSALEEMSQGVTIDTGSLNGFAGALAQMPFFKNDPAKAFDALRGMDQAFSHGDRFQQAQAARAIRGAAGGDINPAAIETRRSLGLFAQVKPETLQMLNAIHAGGTASSFKGGPGGVMSNLFKNAVGGTNGLGGDNQLYEVMNRLGLKGEGGMQIAAKAIKAGGLEGSGISDKELRDATMDPTERLTEAMKNTDGSMLKLNATLQQSLDKAVDGLTNTIIDCTDAIRALIERLGGREAASNIGGMAVGAGTLAAGAMLLPKALKAGVRGLGRGALSLGRGAAGMLGEGIGAAGGALGLEGLGATMATGVGAAGIGAIGATAGVGLGGGLLAGHYLGDPLLDAATGQKNRYGQSSNAAERGIGWLSNKLGTTSDSEYDSMYGTGRSDNLSDDAAFKAKKAAEKPHAPLTEQNTKATDQNTAAIESLTNVIGMLKLGGGMPGFSPGMKVGLG